MVSVGFLVTHDTKSDQIFCCVITQAVPPLNVMDLKIFHPPAQLATPAVSLQNFTAKLAISFRVKLQAWPLRSDSFQNVTCTSSGSCFHCGFGRPNDQLSEARQ